MTHSWLQRRFTLAAKPRGFYFVTKEILNFLPEIEDMPAHVKSSLLGSSLTLPVGDGRLLLGTWQGIYLCEHRNHGGSRSLVAALQENSLAGR